MVHAARLVVPKDADSHVIVPNEGLPHGEDFGLFGEQFPCCMVLLGAGIAHDPVHNPDYDFPDELIATGVDLLDRIVRNVHKP